MSDMNKKVKTKPGLDEILCLLHPTKPPRDILKGDHDTIFDRMERFSDEVLSDDMHFRFRLAVALAQLTWYITPGGLIKTFNAKNSSLDRLMHCIYCDDYSWPFRPWNADRWLYPRKTEIDIDMESIASIPWELCRLAIFQQVSERGLGTTSNARDDMYLAAVNKKHSGSQDVGAEKERVSQVQENEGDNEFAESSAHSPTLLAQRVIRRSDYSLASPPQPKAAQPYRRVRLFKDAVVVPYVRAMEGTRQSKAEWVIAASEVDREDWVSNCVHAGFDKLQAYLDSSDR